MNSLSSCNLWKTNGYAPINSKLQHPPRAYPRHLTIFRARRVGHLMQKAFLGVGNLISAWVGWGIWTGSAKFSSFLAALLLQCTCFNMHYRSAPIETRRPGKVGYPWRFAGITPWKRGCKGCRRFRLLMILKRRILKRELRVMPLSPLKDNADESVLFEGVELFFGKSHFQRSVMCLCKTSQVIISRQKIERLKRRLPRASSWSYQS